MAPTETYVVKSGGNYLAWCGSMYAWGETEAKAREKLRARLDDGRAPGDPVRRALIEDGRESLAIGVNGTPTAAGDSGARQHERQRRE